MSSLTLDPKKTALVVIDLQQGIVSRPTQPYPPKDVIERTSANYLQALKLLTA